MLAIWLAVCKCVAAPVVGKGVTLVSAVTQCRCRARDLEGSEPVDASPRFRKRAESRGTHGHLPQIISSGVEVPTLCDAARLSRVRDVHGADCGVPDAFTRADIDVFPSLRLGTGEVEGKCLAEWFCSAQAGAGKSRVWFCRALGQCEHVRKPGPDLHPSGVGERGSKLGQSSSTRDVGTRFGRPCRAPFEFEVQCRARAGRIVF